MYTGKNLILLSAGSCAELLGAMRSFAAQVCVFCRCHGW